MMSTYLDDDSDALDGFEFLTDGRGGRSSALVRVADAQRASEEREVGRGDRSGRCRSRSDTSTRARGLAAARPRTRSKRTRVSRAVIPACRPRPGVREQVALGEGVGGVDEDLRDPGDPGAAADRRHDRRPVADRRLRDDAAVERRAEHRRVRHRVADAASRRAHAAPPSAPTGRSRSRSGRAGPGATTTAFFDMSPTPCHGSAICTMLTPAISGFSGCTHGSCSRAATADLLAGTRELARLAPARARSRARRIGDRVPHAAECDVDRDRPEPVDLELRIEALGEARARSSARRSRTCRRGSARSPRRRRPAPRAAASSRARASRPCRSRAERSRRRSCSSPTSRDTRSAP